MGVYYRVLCSFVLVLLLGSMLCLISWSNYSVPMLSPFGLRSKDDPKWIAFFNVMSDRNKRIHDHCDAKDRKKNANRANYGHIIVMKEKRLIYCPVFKASSTTWLNYLFDISTSLTQVNKFHLSYVLCNNLYDSMAM